MESQKIRKQDFLSQVGVTYNQLMDALTRAQLDQVNKDRLNEYRGALIILDYNSENTVPLSTVSVVLRDVSGYLRS